MINLRAVCFVAIVTLLLNIFTYLADKLSFFPFSPNVYTFLFILQIILFFFILVGYMNISKKIRTPFLRLTVYLMSIIVIAVFLRGLNLIPALNLYLFESLVFFQAIIFIIFGIAIFKTRNYFKWISAILGISYILNGILGLILLIVTGPASFYLFQYNFSFIYEVSAILPLIVLLFEVILFFKAPNIFKEKNKRKNSR